MSDKANIAAAVLAHVDAGKTTLSEALLYESGMIRRAGRVDNKDAFLDTFALEKEAHRRGSARPEAACGSHGMRPSW